MFNYLAFIHHGIEEAGEDAYADGRTLASECFAQLGALDNPEQFPPRLLILLASSAYIETGRAQGLLDGVYSVCHERKLENLPLIGSSVSAVFFDRSIHERGALLVCLASRLLSAKIAIGEDARRCPDAAVESMLDGLKLNRSVQGEDLNPLGNRLLFTFFPAFGEPDAGRYYPGPDLHETLRRQTHARIPIVGGGSSANDRSRAGLQFAGRQVFIDAIVAARLTTGFPFTSSIGHGLTQTGEVYHIDKLDADKRTILRLKQGVPAEVLGLTEEEDFRLLGELSLDHDPLITIARKVSDQPGAVRLLRELQPNSSLELLRPEPDRMRREAANLVDWSLRRFRVEHPVGAIGIHSTAWRKFGPDVKSLIDDVKDITGIGDHNYVGGFFDGEIGIGQAGRSLFGNWCVSRLLFGDEISARSLFYSGLDAMAKLSQELARVNSLEDAIEHSLDLIRQTGYPGAMLSLLLWNEDNQWLVPLQANGSRYERIVRDCRDQAKRQVSHDDLFAKIAQGEAGSLIPDTQSYPGQEFEVFRGLNLHSQYIKPIRNFEGKSLGFFAD